MLPQLIEVHQYIPILVPDALTSSSATCGKYPCLPHNSANNKSTEIVLRLSLSSWYSFEITPGARANMFSIIMVEIVRFSHHA